MTIDLIIPWRSTPSREHALSYAMERWDRLLPGIEPRFVDAGGPIFGLGASRNLGMRTCEKDVAVIADADTWVHNVPLAEALDGARHADRVHLPFTDYIRLDQTMQNRRIFHSGVGHVYVCAPSVWELVGGQRELAGWWPEDVEFYHRHNRIMGPMARHKGVAYSLDHDLDWPRASDEDVLRANV